MPKCNAIDLVLFNLRTFQQKSTLTLMAATCFQIARFVDTTRAECHFQSIQSGKIRRIIDNGAYVVCSFFMFHVNNFGLIEFELA